MLMKKDKHRSDESRIEQTSSNDIKISEQLETYKNEVFEEIADIERIVYRLMDKNKPEGEEIPIETVRTYTQNPQNNEVNVSEKEGGIKSMRKFNNVQELI